MYLARPASGGGVACVYLEGVSHVTFFLWFRTLVQRLKLGKVVYSQVQGQPGLDTKLSLLTAWEKQ